MIRKPCLYCGSMFTAIEKEIRRGNGKFCSISCSSKHAAQQRMPKPNVSCAYCGKMFYKNRSKRLLSKSGLFFCCRAHKSAAQKIGGITEIMPTHYGTGDGRHSYRKTAFAAYPHQCNRCEYHEHTAVLIVHHKDRNRSNNSIDNLEILCPTCHEVEHLLNRDGRFKST